MPIPPRTDILPRPMPSEYPPGYVPPPLEPTSTPERGSSSSSKLSGNNDNLAVPGSRSTGVRRRRSASPVARVASSPIPSNPVQASTTATATASTSTSSARADSPNPKPGASMNLPRPISSLPPPPQTPRSSQRREMAERGTPAGSRRTAGRVDQLMDVDDVDDGGAGFDKDKGSDMEVDEGGGSATPDVPATTFYPEPAPAVSPHPALQTLQQPTSPIAPPRPLRSPQRSLSSPPVAEDTENAKSIETEVETEDYGSHYRVLLKALEVAVRKGMTKWTVKDLHACFPLLSSPTSFSSSSTGEGGGPGPKEAALRARKFEELHARTAESLRRGTMARCLETLDHYKVAPALKLLNETIARAKLVPEGVVPPDAWRPDLLPKVRIASNNLSLYDSLYLRLKEEYTELHTSSEDLVKSIESKKRRIEAIEGEVRDSVAQLEATVRTFEDFPNEDMVTWMEDMVGGLDGGRRPDRFLG